MKQIEWITVPGLDMLTDSENQERERYVNCYAQGVDYCTGRYGIKMKAYQFILNHNIKSICDVGCGTGIWLEYCLTKTNVEKGYGIDLASITLNKIVQQRIVDKQEITEGMKLNSALCINPGIIYLEGSSKAIDLPDNAVECVTSFEAFEHILPEHIDESIKEVARVTSKYFLLLVCLKPSAEFANKNNHPSLFNAQQWQEKLSKHFSIVKRHAFKRVSKSIAFECML